MAQGRRPPPGPPPDRAPLRPRRAGEVERNWFRPALQCEPEAPDFFTDPDAEAGELVPLDDADREADLAAWQAECEASRVPAAGYALDDTGERHGKPCSRRWIYVHLLEEDARHNGHADLIRELVDGRVGC